MKLFARDLWTKRRRYIVGTVFVLAVIGVFLFWPHATTPITNYAECVAEGNPILETYPPICRAGNQSFTGPTTTELTLPPSQNVAFEILVNGDLADTAPRASESINEQRNWSAYWSRIHSHLPQMPPILPVDFTTSTVLAMNEGPQATSGYVYKITSIVQEADTAVINVTESIPSIGCAVTNTVSNRYYIVRADKLHGTIVFRTNVDHRRCDSKTGITSNTVQ